MTENEAKEWIKYLGNQNLPYDRSPKSRKLACDIAIQALEEIQQYRAIGLTPELIEAMQGHNVALINDLGEYQAIGTVEEFKDLKEKSVAKKPDFTEDKQFALCPNISCNSKGLKDKQQYCDCCGQKLDWQ